MTVPLQVDQPATNCYCLLYSIRKFNCWFVRLIFSRVIFYLFKMQKSYISTHWRQIPNITNQCPWWDHLHQIFKIALLTGIPKGIAKSWIIFHGNRINVCVDLKRWINVRTKPTKRLEIHENIKKYYRKLPQRSLFWTS